MERKAVILPQLAFHNLINFFEPGVRFGADLLNFFPKRRFEFLIFQPGQINSDVHRCPANAGVHREKANANV